MCLVSIVVPVYNVEKYLEKCLTSLIKQTYANIEIIIVDDGSCDTSSIICDEYAKKDKRIKVIHKINEGLSEARNTGIRHTTGSYILFVDGDDFIEQNSIEKLLQITIKNDLEILEANAIKVYDVSNKQIDKLIKSDLLQEKVMTGLQYIIERSLTYHISAAACIKFCKLDFLKDNNLYFEKGRLHEDELWTPKTFLKATKVMFYDFCFYHYIIRENSITQSKNKEKNIKDILKNCYDLEVVYESNSQLNSKEKNILKDYLARQYMSSATLAKNHLNFYLANIDKKFVIRNAKRFTTRLKMLIYLVNVSIYIKLRRG